MMAISVWGQFFGWSDMYLSVKPSDTVGEFEVSGLFMVPAVPQALAAPCGKAPPWRLSGRSNKLGEFANGVTGADSRARELR